MIKEVCVESFSEALAAEKRGADRIELCDNLYLGGTTPSYGTIKMAMEKLTIPAFPIIRPRGGNFHYSKEEIEIMKEDIKVCKSLGAKGVVLGVLTADNKVDFETLKELVDLASPMEVTFHKAVDELENPVEVIDRFVEIGVKNGKSTKHNLQIGVCGEHGGDPKSIEFFEEQKFDYVSCSPFRVPTAILAAAQAYLEFKK